jgi:hypothetical protein
LEEKCFGKNVTKSTSKNEVSNQQMPKYATSFSCATCELEGGSPWKGQRIPRNQTSTEDWDILGTYHMVTASFWPASVSVPHPLWKEENKTVTKAPTNGTWVILSPALSRDTGGREKCRRGEGEGARTGGGASKSF